MNAPQGPNTQNQRPTQQATRQGPPPAPNRPWRQSPAQQEPEKDPGSMTVFRTSNFFVHAFAPLQRTGMLPSSDGGTTIIERIRWISVEKQRLAAAQTRLLPDIETNSLRHEIAI